MARDINTINQTNLWGKQADDGLGLEAQRSDLYFVDFTAAVKNVAKAANVQLAPIIPQYVRSVTLPELRTKAEPIRRDSTPYNMPSWDDPLDPIKLVFLLDTKDEDDNSNVVNFLDAWLALTRAGRGERARGYAPSGNWLKLNSDFRVDFQFAVNIFLLRGAAFTVGGFEAVTWDEYQRATVLANAYFRNQRKRSGSIQQGQAPAASLETSFEAAQGILDVAAPSILEQDMVAHSIWVLKRAWLAAYKLSDLSYTENGLVTVDATFYADTLELAQPLKVEGQSKKVDEAQ